MSMRFVSRMDLASASAYIAPMLASPTKSVHVGVNVSAFTGTATATAAEPNPRRNSRLFIVPYGLARPGPAEGESPGRSYGELPGFRFQRSLGYPSRSTTGQPRAAALYCSRAFTNFAISAIENGLLRKSVHITTETLFFTSQFHCFWSVPCVFCDSRVTAE